MKILFDKVEVMGYIVMDPLTYSQQAFVNETGWTQESP